MPEYVTPIVGEVTNGIKTRLIFFCSANIWLFSFSSGRWMSKALDAIFANLILRDVARGLGSMSGFSVSLKPETAAS